MNDKLDLKTEAPTFGNVLLAPVRVLNLYACLGGNRLLWENCEVTAVELDPEAAKLYQERFPNDNVIVADAHQYLLAIIKNLILYGVRHLVRAIQEQDIGIVQIMIQPPKQFIPI
jgi:site-specific DNA-cytosine methylase